LNLASNYFKLNSQKDLVFGILVRQSLWQLNLPLDYD